MAARRSIPRLQTLDEVGQRARRVDVDDLCLTIDLTKMTLHLIDEDRGEDASPFPVRVGYDSTHV